MYFILVLCNVCPDSQCSNQSKKYIDYWECLVWLVPRATVIPLIIQYNFGEKWKSALNNHLLTTHGSPRTFGHFCRINK